MLKDYKIEKYNCGKLINSSVENSSLHCLFDNDVIIKRGLLGNILIKRYNSYDDFCCFFKDVSANCKEIVKKNNCKRVLFIVFIKNISEKILEQYQKILMFDKEFNLELVSYEVLIVDKETGMGYFGGMNEKGKTLLYKDTLKMLMKKLFV